MFIAVASKTGTEVDQHFGHAGRFLIYDYNGGKPLLVKKVSVDKYCAYVPDEPFRHSRFDAIGAALEGCAAVVTAMIGELPKNELKKIGIRAFSTSGSVDQALHGVYEALHG